MELKVNQKLISVPADYTLGLLLKSMDFSKSVAVFINRQQILMRDYEHYKLNENDSVTIIKPLAGG